MKVDDIYKNLITKSIIQITEVSNLIHGKTMKMDTKGNLVVDKTSGFICHPEDFILWHKKV